MNLAREQVTSTYNQTIPRLLADTRTDARPDTLAILICNV